MELAIVRFFNHLGSGFVDRAAEDICAIPFLVALWAACAIAAFILDKQNGRRVALAVGCALVLHFAISEGLFKHAFLIFYPMRIRPWIADPRDIIPIGTRFQDSSFPSSHAASSAAALTVLAASYPASRPLAVIFLALIALARMHCGMHYPTDVLAGSGLGVGYGLAALALVSKLAGQPLRA